MDEIAHLDRMIDSLNDTKERLVTELKVARALMLQEADIAARPGQMDRLEAGAARITQAIRGLE